MAGEVGADISYFQSFNASGYGYRFIFIRATFGAGMIDPQFANFRAQARNRGIPYRAYYHFLVADVDVQTQFNFFAGVVGNLTSGENVMIDDESYGPTGGLASIGMVQQFAQLCKNRWGIWPIHYSLAGRRIAGCPQTNASYSATNPGGDFWQYSDGTYNYTSLPRSAGGIGNCDMNLCNGTLSDYFLGGAPTPAPPPPPPVQEPPMTPLSTPRPDGNTDFYTLVPNGQGQYTLVHVVQASDGTVQKVDEPGGKWLAPLGCGYRGQVAYFRGIGADLHAWEVAYDPAHASSGWLVYQLDK